jgi:nitrogen-specific signal transduction histidine kinase
MALFGIASSWSRRTWTFQDKNGLREMGQIEKPNGKSSGSDNRATLDKLTRLISIPDEGEFVNDTAPISDENQHADIRKDTLSLTSLCGSGTAQILEALPAGLAVCENSKLIKANSAFALAFGYSSANALENAGGLGTVFPSEMKKLGEHLDKFAGNAEPIILKARSNSGREFRMPIAVHPIEADGNEKACLLVLHPHANTLPKTLQNGDPVSTPELKSKSKPEEKSAGDTKNKKNEKRRKKKGKKSKKNKPDSMVHLSKTDFLAKVSHEVRTPLNSIIGFSELMNEEQLGPIGNERYRGYIKDIHQSGLYALSLVNDLLDISKIEAGEFELNFTAVDLEEVAEESVHSMQPQAQQQRVLLRTDLADGLPDVLADRRSIKQIILNLLSNAVKFTKQGGQVIVSTQRTSSGDVRLRVRDTGIGMSDSEISVALKPFQQVDTAPRNQTGTGLGLPLTKALVEANRAKFKLRSISESGTQIDVIFPQGRVANAKDAQD